MRFLYPLGFLGLIGIPILIIIYIIKNKYTEQVIASTYIWTLSEKFLKKKLPIHRLVGLISLILQIITVLFISLAVAHPVFAIANAADDYVFILDGSGSMNIVQDDRTRLDLAKDEISGVINDAMEGSTYSLVFIGKTTDIIFDGVEDKENALKLLDAITPAYTAAGLTDAIGTAQTYFNENNSGSIYLVTDKAVELTQNVTVVNVAREIENYAISDVTYSTENEKLNVEGNVLSYASDAKLTLNLYIDNAAEAVATLEVNAKKGKSEPFAIETAAPQSFRSLRVAIAEEDALALDNEVSVYNVQAENAYTAIIVSDSPFFLYSALLSSGSAQTECISTDDYVKLVAENYDDSDGGRKLGYDLYIFDDYDPEVMPQDGAIWFVNPKNGVTGAGFAVQEEVEFTDAQIPKYTEDSASMVTALLKNIDLVDSGDIYIKKYKKCGTNRKFTTLLSVEGNPLLFTGTNSYGNREVVFAFDLHNSNFPLLGDYLVLTDNLLTYTFPAVIEKVSYECGETMEINVIANCDSIRVESPLGKISYLDTSSAVSEYELTEVGVYSVKVIVGGNERVFNVFSAMDAEEGDPAPREDAFVITGEAGTDKRDGIYSDILYIFILLALVCAADWMVYCYEQYQLR